MCARSACAILLAVLLACLFGPVDTVSAQNVRLSTGSVHAEPILAPDGGPATGAEPWSHDVGGRLSLGIPVSNLFDVYGGVGVGQAVSLEVGTKLRPWRGQRLEPYLQTGYGRYAFEDQRTSVIPLGLGLDYQLNERAQVFFEVEHRWSALQFPPGVDRPFDPPEVESSWRSRVGISFNVGGLGGGSGGTSPSPGPGDLGTASSDGAADEQPRSSFTPAEAPASAGGAADSAAAGRFGATRFDPNRHEGMNLLPDGSFIMGLHAEDPLAVQTAGRKQVTVNAFYIDEHEVSNAEYRAYLDDLSPAEREAALPDSTVWAEARSQESWGLYFRGEVFADYPVVGVTWNEASDYCEAQGGRLPTEAEWEYAARGGRMGQIYPWEGFSTRDEEGNFLANFQPREGYPADGYAFTAPVESFPPNNWGLHHMAGNVAEWTRDAYTPSYENISDFNPYFTDEDEPRRVVRGGSWASTPYFIGVGVRATQPKGEASVNIGFRCVREVSSGDRPEPEPEPPASAENTGQQDSAGVPGPGQEE